MTPIIPSLSPLFEFLLPRNISGTDFGTGYGGTVCGFHTRPPHRPLLATENGSGDWSNYSFYQVIFIFFSN